MPIYEYVCPRCAHPFERRVSIADGDKAQACPSCGHERTVKQVSLVARRGAGLPGADATTSAACGPVG